MPDLGPVGPKVAEGQVRVPLREVELVEDGHPGQELGYEERAEGAGDAEEADADCEGEDGGLGHFPLHLRGIVQDVY